MSLRQAKRAASRRRAKAPTRGFTLVELLIAVLIGGVSILVAAKVGQVVLQQSQKGRQRTDFSVRSQLLTRQLRADIRAAGLGSTGAVTVDVGRQPWGTMAFATVGGFNALAAATGADNVGAAAVGGRSVLLGSDAVQLVVPNPSTAEQTADRALAGSTVLPFGPGGLGRLGACPQGMILLVDHSAPTGAGRSQLLFVAATSPAGITTQDNLQFTAASGSDVMCARVSTYWVDDQAWLHRSDLVAGSVPVALPGSRVYVDATNLATDVIAPGILDLQIAYRVSAEIYTLNNQNPPSPAAGVAGQWAYEGIAGNASALLGGNGPNWFEVRMVRMSLLARTLRRIDQADRGMVDHPGRENGPSPIRVSRTIAAEWTSATEALTNLRYFDLGAPSGVRAEPY